MSYIRSEVLQLAADLLNKEGQDATGLSYLQLRDAVDQIFVGQRIVKPDGQPLQLRDLIELQKSGKEKMRSKIVELREQFHLPSRMRLGQLISLAESARVHNDTALQDQYARLFEEGIYQDVLRQELRFKNQYEDRDLKFLIENQSPEKNRSVVELVSNAIDFSEADGQVEVEITEGGYVVTDHGQGMSQQQLIEQLCIPFLSGYRENTNSPIGKFGMGFFTVLRHLEKEGDVVIVQTGQGETGSFLEFTIQNGEIMVRLGTQNEHTQGTSVFVYSANFQDEDAQYYLHEQLKYKRGASVKINDVELSQPEDMKFIDAQDSYLGYTLSKTGVQRCPAVIAINGISVMSFTLTGENLPNELVISLPFATELSESRDVVVYSETVVAAGKAILAELLSSQNLNSIQKVQVANALAELFSAFEMRAHTKDESIVAHIEHELSAFVSAENLSVIPAVEGLGAIYHDGQAAVSLKLPEAYASFFNEKDRIHAFRSAGCDGYVADFSADADQLVIYFESTILIDRRLYEQLKEYPSFLAKYINFVISDRYISVEGYAQLQEKRGQSVFNLEGINARFFDPSIERQLSDTAVRPFDALEGKWRPGLWTGSIALPSEVEVSDAYYKWRVALVLPEALVQEMHAYLIGETETFEFSQEFFEQIIAAHKEKFTGEVEMVSEEIQEVVYREIRELFSQRDEMLAALQTLRSFVMFFSPERMQSYVGLGSALQDQFVADFFEQFADDYSEAFTQTRSILQEASQYDPKHRTIEEIEHSFEFIHGVMEEVLFGDGALFLQNSKDFKQIAIRELLCMHSSHFKTKLRSLEALQFLAESKDSVAPEYTEMYQRLLSINWAKIVLGKYGSGFNGLNDVFAVNTNSYRSTPSFDEFLKAS